MSYSLVIQLASFVIIVWTFFASLKKAFLIRGYSAHLKIFSLLHVHHSLHAVLRSESSFQEIYVYVTFKSGIGL